MTPKQQRFVEEYLIDLNATQAAIRTGYSKATANEQGARLLANVSIAAAIKKAMDERSARTKITADRVLLEIGRIAFSNLREIIEWGPNGVVARPSGDLDDDTSASVAEVGESVTKDGDILLKVKKHDKVAALKLAGEHLGLFTKKVEVSVPDARIHEIIARAAAESGLTEEQAKRLLAAASTEIKADAHVIGG